MYLERLFLENCWRDIFTKNSKFVIRIASRVPLQDDITSQNRLCNLLLPLRLTWPTSPPLDPAVTATPPDPRSPASSSCIPIKLPLIAWRIISASSQWQRTLAAQQVTAAGLRWDASVLRIAQRRPNIFFHPLKILDTQIPNPGHVKQYPRYAIAKLGASYDQCELENEWWYMS